MIPKGLDKKIILKACKFIDKNGVPINRRSRTYELYLNGGKYPPKYVISIAYQLLTGNEWKSEKFNAVEARNFFIARKYDIHVYKQVITIKVSSDESSFPEGKEVYRAHRRLERDSNFITQLKIKKFQEDGDLSCKICSFSYYKVYGELGNGYIEAHHITPVSKLKGDRKTTEEDIVFVCSNCHRMLHRKRPWLSVSKLKKLLK